MIFSDDIFRGFEQVDFWSWESKVQFFLVLEKNHYYIEPSKYNLHSDLIDSILWYICMSINEHMNNEKNC